MYNEEHYDEEYYDKGYCDEQYQSYDKEYRYGVMCVNENRYDEVLEYTREYKILNEQEILELIKRAKKEGWRALDLSNCGLSSLPAEIGLLDDLEILIIGNGGYNDSDTTDSSFNIFKTLPKEIGNLKRLKILLANNTRMQYLPDEFGKLVNLIDLNMHGCDFQVFPRQIYKLHSLQGLAINNKFTYIEDDIQQLQELRELWLTDSKIKTLPKGIGKLSKLRILALSRSGIEKLPNNIMEMKSIEKILIDDTVISRYVPPEILEQSTEEIVQYILQYQITTDKSVLKESKMIIVGQGGVGKTCLLNRLVNDKYICNPSTEGIDITEWEFIDENESYKLNIWDFGGQEIYHSTHQFFLTKRSLYVFVWDARQEDEYGRIDYWLKTIQAFSGDSPIILVINKCDESRKNIREIDIYNIKKRFPQIISEFKISCQDNINISELRKEIVYQAKKLPLMTTTWFTSWINIRKELQKLSVEFDFISYQEYIDICRENGLEDKESLSLIKYLHDLGVVLYIHEDILLRDIVILKPEWGTQAVYKILDAQTNILSSRNGILYSTDLMLIWSNEQIYPRQTFAYIIGLMNKFELMFKLSDESYLVVELLENKEVNVELDFQRNNTLYYRYQYEFLPAGIMTKFIVRVHRYLIETNKTKLCWKKGAYLEWKSAYAVVKLSDGITDRYIDIKVSGNNNRNKRELLTIIREAFEGIHKSISKLECEGQVLCCCNEECDYFHSYNYLIRLEDADITTTRCTKTLKEIHISNLLDGVKKNEEYSSNKTNNYQFDSSLLGNIRVNTLSKNEKSKLVDEHNKKLVLHISDIHILNEDEADNYSLQLSVDLRTALKVDKIDYLVISGDIGNYSTEKEYISAYKFIKQIVQRFKIKQEKIIIVPGNHDLNWEKSKEAVVDEKGIETVFDKDIYMQRFCNFSQYLYTPLINKQYPSNPEDQIFLSENDNDKILFMTLNSAYEIDHINKKNSKINIVAINKLYEKLTDEKYNDWLKILVIHHPIKGDEGIQNEKSIELLIRLGFKICMHGHIHEAKYDFSNYGSDMGMNVIGAGTFGAPANEQVTGIPLQYNFIEINSSNSIIKVMTRKKESTDGAWCSDARWGSKDAPKDYYNLEIR